MGRRLFSSTTSCRAPNKKKSIPIKRSRATKSLLGVPKAPGSPKSLLGAPKAPGSTKSLLGDPTAPGKTKLKAQKTVTTYTEYGNSVYSSLARATATVKVKPKVVTSQIQESSPDIAETNKSNLNNAAEPEDSTVAANLQSAPANPAEKSSQIQDGDLTAVSSPDTSSANNVGDRPVDLEEQASQPETPTQTLSDHGYDGPVSGSLALVAVSCVEDRPIHFEEPSFAIDLWMSKFRRLDKGVAEFELQQKTIRKMINRIKTSINAEREKIQSRRLKRFKQAVDYTLDAAGEQVLHKEELAKKFVRIHNRLGQLEWTLRALYSSSGNPIYDQYAKLFANDKDESQKTSHDWREFLELRLKIDEPFTTSREAQWIYNRRMFYVMLFKPNVQLTQEIHIGLKGVLAAQSKDRLRRATIVKVSKAYAANKELISLMLDIRRALHPAAVIDFFKTKPRSNIHWQQLDFWAPFQDIMMSYFRVRSDTGKLFRGRHLQHSIVDKRRILQYSLLSDVLVSLRELMLVTRILLNQLFEIHWIRLNLERSSSTFQAHPGIKVRKPLSSNPRRFNQWVDHLVYLEPTSFGDLTKKVPQNEATGNGGRLKMTSHSIVQPSGSSKTEQNHYSAGEDTEYQTKSEEISEEISEDEIYLFSQQSQPFQPAHKSSPYPSYWSHKLSRGLGEESQKSDEIGPRMSERRDAEDDTPVSVSGPWSIKGRDAKKSRSRAASGRQVRGALSSKSSRKKPIRRTQRPRPRRPQTYGVPSKVILDMYP